MIQSIYRLKLSGNLLDDFKQEVINSNNKKLKIIKFEKNLLNEWELVIDYEDVITCMLYEGIIHKYKVSAENLTGEN